ncbi:MAG: molybdenum cofactor synthesis domain-containing protein [Sphaerochaeta sp.]|uniref:molybdenum cofactor synthesis domain-containing protein n=1 Tax=Sphaerochaeta sp. TaxID=1972642 RepID=UPI002FC5E5DC
MIEGTVKAVCTSEKKGTAKQPRQKAVFRPAWGIEGDAHAGAWHRQVSLLSFDKVQAFRQEGAEVVDGDFGENLLVSGIDFRSLAVGSLCCSGEVVLRISQIGKECHHGCLIFQRMGHCIMPREGVFATVLHGGTIEVGMPMQVYEEYRAYILCSSDRSFANLREDAGTPLLKKRLEAAGFSVVGTALLPDDRSRLAQAMAEVCDSYQADILVTTGGTGLSLRDVTPEATLDIAHRQVPGLAELMRSRCLAITERAALSRGVCATRNQTLIVNLPGSPKAAVENLEALLPVLDHGLSMLEGRSGDCAETFQTTK